MHQVERLEADSSYLRFQCCVKTHSRIETHIRYLFSLEQKKFEYQPPQDRPTVLAFLKPVKCCTSQESLLLF